MAGPSASAGADEPPPRRGRRWLIGVAAALAAGAAVTAALWAAGVLDGAATSTLEVREDRDAVDAEPPAETAAPPAPVLAGEWRTLPEPPIHRDNPSLTWTGEQVLVWGGVAGARPRADGAALDPATGAWRRIPEGPLTGRSFHAAVWTGRELIVWGGRPGLRTVPADAAAYDPAAERWRVTAPAPNAPVGQVFGTWTGTEAVFAVEGPGAGVHAYDPEADRWRSLPQVPEPLGRVLGLEWSGAQLIAVASGGVAILEEGSWQIRVRVGLPPFGAAVAWTGQDVLVWGGVDTARRHSEGHLLDLDAGAARTLPRPWLRGTRTGAAEAWSGRWLFVWGAPQAEAGAQAPPVAAFEPDRTATARGRWWALPLPPPQAGTARAQAAVWTGEEVLVWQRDGGVIGFRPPDQNR